MISRLSRLHHAMHLAWSAMLLVTVAAAQSPVDFRDADALLEAGRATEAMERFERIRRTARGEHAVLAAIGQAACQQALGLDCSALATLESVQSSVGSAASPVGVEFYLALAEAALRQHRLLAAQTHLEKSNDWATQLNDPNAQARVFMASMLQRGMEVAARHPGDTSTPPDFHLSFDYCLKQAQAAQNLKVELRARLGLAKVLILLARKDAQTGRGQWNRISEQADTVVALLEKHPALDASGELWLAGGECQLWLSETAESSARELAASRAMLCFKQAGDQAARQNNPSVLSQATGYRGRLALNNGQLEVALALTGEALFQAQIGRDELVSFLWQRQSAAIFNAQNQHDEAQDFLRLAARTFRSVRARLSAFDVSFRLGPLDAEDIYREQAEQCFTRASLTTDPRRRQEMLKEARGAMEAYTAARIERQFFSRECAQLLDRLSASVDDILAKLAEGTAVIHIMPLARRTEITVSIKNSVARVTVEGTKHEDLKRLAASMRDQLSRRPNADAVRIPPECGQLYNLLIRPVQSSLNPQRIHQLVFVLDGDLASVPMAALHDGTRFLVEQYAIAVSPGLSMLQPGATPPTREARIVLSALTSTKSGRDALPHAGREVQGIASAFPRHRLLQGEAFTKAALKIALADPDVTRLHLATHGRVGASSEDTLVQTYEDEPITLDELEALLRPFLLRERPLELLTLSACETVLGNDRGAYGLAGVAVKSGARSVVATLWRVDDSATADIMTKFYQNLAGGKLPSKAAALQAVQKHLLQSAQEEHSHPFFWASYVLLGNWL